MRLFLLVKSLYTIIKSQYNVLKRNTPENFGEFHENDIIEDFKDIKRPQLIHLSRNVKIRAGFRFISFNSELHIGKFSTLANDVTIVTGNHRPTVGVPQCLLDFNHINDNEDDMFIGEDVWVGTNVTLIHGARLSRGVVVGACSLVNKYVPPYAVVAGIPAKIIAVKFTKEQIIAHEKALYNENERLSKEELNEIFEKYYQGIRSIGETKLTDEQNKIVTTFLKQVNG